MKLPTAAIIAVTLTLAAAITSYAVAHDSAPAQIGCGDDCSISAHAMQSGPEGPLLHGASNDVAMTNMSGMQATPAAAASTAPAADTSMDSMSMPMHGGHMQMTPARQASPADREKANQIVAALKIAMEPYKDYQAAEAAGYIPFHPEFKQAIYHFTNMRNAFLNQFSFDPTRPTSLMYKQVDGGYELVGAMYTAPRAATLDQLDSRVPLGVATWHLHVNLCKPPQGMEREMLQPNPQFGLAGSITTQTQCEAAGGQFFPVIYNWMVHVWPFETDPAKVWASEEHPGAMNE